MSSSAPAPSPKPVQIHVTEDGGVECSSNSCGRSGYCIGGILFVDRPACFELKFCSCLSLPLSPFLSVDLYKFQAPLQQSHPSYFVLNRFHCFVFVLLFFFPSRKRTAEAQIHSRSYCCWNRVQSGNVSHLFFIFQWSWCCICTGKLVWKSLPLILL